MYGSLLYKELSNKSTQQTEQKHKHEDREREIYAGNIVLFAYHHIRSAIAFV